MRPYTALPLVSRVPIKGRYSLPYSSLPAPHSCKGGVNYWQIKELESWFENKNVDFLLGNAFLESAL